MGGRSATPKLSGTQTVRGPANPDSGKTPPAQTGAEPRSTQPPVHDGPTSHSSTTNITSYASPDVGGAMGQPALGQTPDNYASWAFQLRGGHQAFANRFYH